MAEGAPVSAGLPAAPAGASANALERLRGAGAASSRSALELRRLQRTGECEREAERRGRLRSAWGGARLRQQAGGVCAS